MRTTPYFSLTWANSSGMYDLQPTTINWTFALSTVESDQIGILIDTTGISTAGVNVFLRISWVASNELGDPLTVGGSGNAYITAPESVETIGSRVLISGSDYSQRYAFDQKEWGPIPKNLTRMLWLPVAAPYYQLGVYTDTSPGGSDVLVTGITLAALEQSQDSG